MSKVRLYVEGVADQKFFQDLILDKYKVTLPITSSKDSQPLIYNIEGIAGDDLENDLTKLQPRFQEDAIRQMASVVILDADDDFASRKALLDRVSVALGFNYFLLPNHDSNGALEELLEGCIHGQHQQVFDCWDSYDGCLSAKQNPCNNQPYSTPIKKAKIYSYMTALLGKSKSQLEKAKEIKRDYRNQCHWDLSSPALVNLISFLDPYFR